MNPRTKKLYDGMPVVIQNAMLTAFSARLDRQRYGGRFREFQSLMQEAQYWDRAKLGEWQDARLRAIVSHADEHVPYYQELFRRHGIRPEKFRGREDLKKIPLLTRDLIKARIGDLVSRATSRDALSEGHTSGTTGSPLTMFYDADMMHINYAALDRQYAWAGVQLKRGGDRIAVLRGNIIVPLHQKQPPFWRYNWLHRHLLLSNFHMTSENLVAYFDAIRDFGTKVLDGYPSSVYVLAKTLLRRGEKLPLHAVLTSSETLYDFQREAMEEAFQCKVFDYFGAAERVIFATECGRGEGHHLCEEYGYTEVVDEAGNPVPDGTEGFLVGTTLHNCGMPLIRYRTSDRSAVLPQACSCGRPLRLMRSVTTKAEDLLKLRDGRLISPSALTHPFKPLDSIEASQIVQTDLDRILIRLIPRPDYAQPHADHLVRELKARLGSDMRVDIELCKELPRTKAGKFKWVISQVDTGL